MHPAEQLRSIVTELAIDIMDARAEARHTLERRVQLQELSSSLNSQVASLRAQLASARRQ
jgi:hypothetical protein